jgi:hypothetical protein
MKKAALALALVLAGSSLAVGLASADANAGGRKICKQALMTHPMAGEHRDPDEAVQSRIQSLQEGP